MQSTPPIPDNEFERLLDLAEFDIDYTNLESNFEELINLAAKIAGTKISLINLIDSYTQWTIANFGLDVEQTPRNETICQYTILEEDHYEIEDLTLNERFFDKDFVTGELGLRYYLGVPLKTSKGYNVGTLCVMDSEKKKLTPEKIELLKLVANEVLTRLNAIKKIHDFKLKINEVEQNQKKVAHDIRGPIAGIIGLSNLIKSQGDENTMEEVLELIDMINSSSVSLIELADEILATNNIESLNDDEFNLIIFKEKLEKLYLPQAKNKQIFLSVNLEPENQHIRFKRDKLLQISGNLISNAIKFTPDYGVVQVNLDLQIENEVNTLLMEVNDSGLGLDEAAITSIINGDKQTSAGTSGEKGFGFGLNMVNELINSLKATLHITSELGKGSKFKVIIPNI
ncbi:MAG: sensor histidine kinase [Flavobacteriales bacterium]|nr:MAG: sensor histidine kinase [Flavobacteriales bacterium]